jgi:hypothetical protein
MHAALRLSISSRFRSRPSRSSPFSLRGARIPSACRSQPPMSLKRRNGRPSRRAQTASCTVRYFSVVAISGTSASRGSRASSSSSAQMVVSLECGMDAGMRDTRTLCCRSALCSGVATMTDSAVEPHAPESKQSLKLGAPCTHHCQLGLAFSPSRSSPSSHS